MTTKTNKPRRHNAEPLVSLRLRRRRRHLIVHLALDTRWLAGVVVGLAGLWIGLEPLARLLKVAAGLP